MTLGLDEEFVGRVLELEQLVAVVACVGVVAAGILILGRRADVVEMDANLGVLLHVVDARLDELRHLCVDLEGAEGKPGAAGHARRRLTR